MEGERERERTTGVGYLSEWKQGEEPYEADAEEESHHPTDGGLLVAPRHVAFGPLTGHLVGPLVQPKQEGAKPTCGRSSEDSSIRGLRRQEEKIRS